MPLRRAAPAIAWMILLALPLPALVTAAPGHGYAVGPAGGPWRTLPALPPHPEGPGVDALQNGGFESGTTAGWTVTNADSGDWSVYSGTSSPVNHFVVPAPPEGTYAALTDQLGPGAHLLTQDVSLPTGTAGLALTVYYQNHASAFATPDSLSDGTTPNQQFRVDVMTTSSPLDSVGGGDVLATLFRTNVGDPLTLAPTRVCADLTPWAGQTLRLRFAEVDNQYYFDAGVDDVQVTDGLCTPELTIAAGPGAGELSLSWGATGGTSLTVSRGLASGGESVIATLDGSATGYADQGLAEGTRYYYTVTAHGSGGHAATSDEASAVTFARPSAPDGLFASASRDPQDVGVVKLDWGAPESDGGTPVTSYVVYRAAGAGSPFEAVAVVADDSFFDHTPSPLQVYHYKVTAVNLVGEGPPSREECEPPTPIGIVTDEVLGYFGWDQQLCAVPHLPV